MQITDVLAQMGGLQSIARELGITEEQAARGTSALAPAVLGGFKKQAQSQPSGLEGLGGILGRLGGGELLDDVLAPKSTNVNRGNNVLGQIFGSKDVSRAVAQNASSQTGLSPDLLKRMLPMIAMMVAGYMAKQAGGSAARRGSTRGGLVGLLSSFLGGSRRSGALGAPSRRTRAGAEPGAGGFASMLDMDGDGNPLDDIMRTVGKR
ncbi:MAG TPA: DUF937 domain-containing protein [Gammaproteobacteria bacterium]